MRRSRGSELALVPAAGVTTAAEERNPFTLPSDKEIFQLREHEDDEEALRKTALVKKKIWEKTTAASRVGRAKKLTDADFAVTDTALVTQQAAQRSRGIVAAATAAAHHKTSSAPREEMSSFLAQKREMFLVQMSLDTKREEIQKLEEKAHAKEEALKRAELLLEEVRSVASCTRRAQRWCLRLHACSPACLSRRCRTGCDSL
jgi:hypothetical protein